MYNLLSRSLRLLAIMCSTAAGDDMSPCCTFYFYVCMFNSSTAARIIIARVAYIAMLLCARTQHESALFPQVRRWYATYNYFFIWHLAKRI